MNVATKDYVQLTHGEGKNENPSWAPDGVHIVFMSKRAAIPARFAPCWRMELSCNN